MKQISVEKDISETLNNISLWTNRLYCIFKLLSKKEIENKERVILNNFILEIINNIEIESYNCIHNFTFYK